MLQLRKVIEKVIFPKLHGIEESPTVTILGMSSENTSNPFSGTEHNESYDDSKTVDCIFSEEPEIISSGNNVTTQKVIYFYIKVPDFPELSLKNRFVFKGIRYKAMDVQDLFGLWKVKVVKS